MRVTKHDLPASRVALAAFRAVLPDMPEAEAERQAAAIVYAAANHTKWFWGGIYGS
jgi:hypothetical protein